MTREHLKSASETLRTASEEASNEAATERLTEQAEHLSELADADRGPDHGRLARHEHALEDVKALLGPEHEGYVDEALEEMRSYRETLEGV
jgi:GAF domain-containing protein